MHNCKKKKERGISLTRFQNWLEVYQARFMTRVHLGADKRIGWVTLCPDREGYRQAKLEFKRQRELGNV